MTTFLTAGTNAGFGVGGIIIYLVFFLGLMYFLLIRPQQKQAKQAESLQNSVAPGDSIMTTSGFYGTVLDIVDDSTVIVEFGNNKNCRIPMHKKAIAEVEKAGSAVADSAAEEKTEDAEKETGKKKKGIFEK